MKVQTILMVALGVIIPAVMCSNNDCTKSPEWQAYKTKFNKHYESSDEENMRCEIWQQNVDEVKRHNLDETQTYKRGVNHFSDRTSEENKRSRGLVMPKGLPKLPLAKMPQSDEIPSKWDWRDHGAVTSVKNQGSCGSCWAFAIAGVMETQYFVETQKLVSFSEQQMVDCSKDDNGCNGGWPYNTLLYLARTGGLQTNATYPYAAKKQSCKYTKSKALKMNLVDIYQMELSDLTDENIRLVIYYFGPVSVAVCASQDGFDSYSSGIYHGSGECNQIDHAVLLVGYVNEGDSCYYILKNSWSESWGNDGYMHIACGSNKLVQYPTIALISV